MKPELSIIVPTITGREHWLERAEKGFRRRIPERTNYEWIVVKDEDGCGRAWNVGFGEATGDYLCFAADDLEPAWTGWIPAAIKVISEGKIPCATILNSDSSLQACGDSYTNEFPDGAPAHIARVPFLSREQAEAIFPIIETHYFTDNYVSWAAERAGWPTVVCNNLCFFHHYAREGRNEVRYEADRAVYEAAMASTSMTSA